MYKTPTNGAIVPQGLFVTILVGDKREKVLTSGCRVKPHYQVVKVSDDKLATQAGITPEKRPTSTKPPTAKQETESK